MQLFEEVDNQQCTEVDLTPTLPNVEGNVQMESEAPVEPVAIANTDTYGYVLAIDNLDMNVRCSFQRVDRTTQSMHLCHAYAALNRIDTSGLEDGSMSGILSPAVVLPNAQDLQRLIDDFKLLNCHRMLVRHHPDFAVHQVFVDWYIDSEHSDKMSKKSVVVPLGVQLHNENKLNEMTQILLALNKYVPCNTVETSVHVDGEKYTQEETQLGPRLIFADQLTSARVRGATALCCFHKTSLTHLEGYIPVTSDWHARLCYVTVLQNRFYSTTPQDKGTLFQLKQIINRTSFGKVPKQNMKAAEDFLDVVLCAHVLTAAEQVMESPENGSVHLDCKAVANLITEQFVKISIPQLEEESTDATSTTGNDENPISVPLLSTDATPGDSVYTYATDFLTTALLWYGFHDAIKMGDGSRITTYWKFLTAIFNQTGHCNYAKEGFLMLAQSSLLPPECQLN
ncbi:uncharacterized protein [Dysidea avara]|uniref:uncharacterized protein n=1 Tax=Dysidea avara TaxID=196820 RepID=UPI003325B48E